jgi:hypothetical protein
MPTLLSDPSSSVYLLLAAAGITTLVVWLGRRDRKSLAVLLGVVGAIALVFLIDRLFESPREEAERRVRVMVRAADAKDPEAFVAQLADTVEIHGSNGASKWVRRDEIRNSSFWGLLRQFNIRVAAWDFSRSDVKQIDRDTIEIGFLAKGEGDGKPFPYYIRTTFARQPDGQFKLSAFRAFEPLDRSKPATIPSFP